MTARAKKNGVNGHRHTAEKLSVALPEMEEACIGETCDAVKGAVEHAEKTDLPEDFSLDEPLMRRVQRAREALAALAAAVLPKDEV